MRLHAWYTPDGPTLITTAPALDAVLDDVAGRGGAELIELSDAADPMARGILLAGLDATRHVGVAFWTADQDGYYSTNGATTAGPPLLYYHQDHEREFPADAEVPLLDVRRAAREFLTTGQRPQVLRWRLHEN